MDRAACGAAAGVSAGRGGEEDDVGVGGDCESGCACSRRVRKSRRSRGEVLRAGARRERGEVAVPTSGVSGIRERKTRESSEDGLVVVVVFPVC